MESSPQKKQIEVVRGGCLDAGLKVISFGILGIETMIDSTDVVKPDTFTLDEDGEKILVKDPASITMKVIQTGEPVVYRVGVNDSPTITRRIVRNRRNE